MAVASLGQNFKVPQVAVCKIIIFYCNFYDFTCTIQNGCAFQCAASGQGLEIWQNKLMWHVVGTWCYTTTSSEAHLGCLLDAKFKLEVFFLSRHPGVARQNTHLKIVRSSN
jgi:hypothetical protein